MINSEIKLEQYIDYTILKPDATKAEVTKILNEAKQYNFAVVCINPIWVKYAKDYLKDTTVKVGTTIGFPLGANSSEVKAFEAQKAIADGADELDMVINIAALKDKDYKKLRDDIAAVVEASKGKTVKVIIETDLITREEIIEACKASVDAGAQFVKTSTGFVKGGIGAKVEDVELMYKTVSQFGLEVKASGGVKDKATALAMIDAGATRIGTSSGIQIVSGGEGSGY